MMQSSLSEKERRIFEEEGSNVLVASASVVSFTLLFHNPYALIEKQILACCHRYALIVVFLSQQAKNIPWRAILTSRPVYALFLANFTRSWVFAMVLTELPQYFADAFSLNVATVRTI